MSTPAGDSFVSDGTHSAGSPVQWGTPQDHAVCNDAIQAAAALGAREALLSLAAEFDRRSDQHLGPASLTYASAARIASQRAQNSGTEGNEAAPVSTEGQDRSDGLSPAEAYMEGVKAERVRVIDLADQRNATYVVECRRTDCDHPTHQRGFADLIEDSAEFGEQP